MIYTSTTIQKFMDCPRKYYHHQIQGYFPKSRPEYVKIGSLFHQAMDIWASERKDKAKEHIRDQVSEIYDRVDEFPDLDPDNLEVSEQTHHREQAHRDGIPGTIQRSCSCRNG